MKDRLTPEQSQHLIELGVDPSKASMCMLYFPESDSSEPLEAWQMWEECGILLCNPDESRVQDVECVIVPKDADYDQSAKEEHPIFDLSDLLAILPKEMIVDEVPYHLNIDYPYLTGGVAARFLDETGGSLTGVLCPELIDALFELLCWTLTGDKNEKGKQ